MRSPAGPFILNTYSAEVTGLIVSLQGPCRRSEVRVPSAAWSPSRAAGTRPLCPRPSAGRTHCPAAASASPTSSAASPSSRETTPRGPAGPVPVPREHLPARPGRAAALDGLPVRRGPGPRVLGGWRLPAHPSETRPGVSLQAEHPGQQRGPAARHAALRQLCAALTRLVAERRSQVSREMAVAVLSNLAQGDPAAARSIALQKDSVAVTRHAAPPRRPASARCAAQPRRCWPWRGWRRTARSSFGAVRMLDVSLSDALDPSVAAILCEVLFKLSRS